MSGIDQITASFKLLSQAVLQIVSRLPTIPPVYILGTTTDITTSTIPSYVDAIITAGYATTTDFGGAIFVRYGSSAPPWTVQSADGAYWLNQSPITNPNMGTGQVRGTGVDVVIHAQSGFPASPPTGLIIYNTDDGYFYGYSAIHGWSQLSN